MHVKKTVLQGVTLYFPNCRKSIQNLNTTTYLAIFLNTRNVSTSEHRICGRWWKKVLPGKWTLLIGMCMKVILVQWRLVARVT